MTYFVHKDGDVIVVQATLETKNEHQLYYEEVEAGEVWMGHKFDDLKEGRYDPDGDFLGGFDERFAVDYNENHDPQTGQFSEGAYAGARPGPMSALKAGKMAVARNAVRKLANVESVKAAGKAVLKKAGENKHALINGAVQATLLHGVGTDYGPDIHDAIHHEIEHFAHNAKIAIGRAKEMMHKVGSAILAHLRKLRSAFSDALTLEDAELDRKELDLAIAALEKTLPIIEAYQPKEA